MRTIVGISSLMLVGGTLAALLVAADGETHRIARNVTPQAAAEDRSADERAILHAAHQLAATFTATDAPAFAALFTPDAEIVDCQGHIAHGREAISRIVSGVFQQSPQARVLLENHQVHFLGPNVAVNEASVRVQPHEDAEAETIRYRSTYVAQDGKWLVANSREVVDDEATAADELKRLDWLVGTWIDESSAGLTTTTYHWADGDKYLIGEFSVRVHGELALTGSERIGWDPQAKKLRSWVFDSSGGFAEGLWTRQGGAWVLKLSGVTREGHVGSATNVYQPLGEEKYAFESRDRVVADKFMPNRQTTVVRQPPTPGE